VVGNRQNPLVRAAQLSRVEYHGWKDSYVLTNGIVEAVVVPSISRIMQLRLADNERGVFWENRELDGDHASGGCEWKNFGGDKAWPAPQKDWESRTGRAWPPPTAYDAASCEARAENQGLTLISPIDDDYGMQVLRHIALKPGLPVMEVTSLYRKVVGPLVRVGVWVVTQLRDPQSVFALLPESHKSGDGYARLSGPVPLDAHRKGRLLSLRRDPAHNLKIAIDGDSLAWMDHEHVLRIDASSALGAENRCSTAVYTNMDPLQYVELESEGEVTPLAIGCTLMVTNTYTLAPRSVDDATAEACKIFGLAM